MSAHVTAFCEPLNEALSLMTEEQIAGLNTTSSQLNHPALDAPYFKEYLPLLHPEIPGVLGYRPEFGLLSYFANVEDQPQGLKEYIQGLLDHARLLNKQPVLKFTRGLGRAAWLRQLFPGARQILLLRNPIEQFCSGLELAERTNNYTFLMIPPLVISRYCCGPLATQRNRLGIPRLDFGSDIGSYAAAYIDLSRTLPIAALLGAHLCMFVASIAKARPYADLVIDQDLLAASDTYLQDIEREIEQVCEISIDLSNYRSSPVRTDVTGMLNNYNVVADNMLACMEEDFPEAVEFTRRYIRRQQIAYDSSSSLSGWA